MGSGVDDIEALVRRLDDGSEHDAVRGDAARLVVRLLGDRTDPLTSWEKMHFEMAIALMPTVWLRLCLTHLRMALETPPPDVRSQIERDHAHQFDGVTLEGLVARVGKLGYE